MDHLWMDQGGTFTDVVRLDATGLITAEKVLSSSAEIEALAAEAGEVRRATTVATNALLERTCPPVLLITNEGFGDLPWLGDGRRPDLFKLNITRPEPLVAAVLEVGGRIDADGHIVAPLSLDEHQLQSFYDDGIRSVAVVLIHGALHPATENTVAGLCRKIGFTTVSVGHKIAPSRGFLSRLYTTAADAGLTPLLPQAEGMYMRSDGGLSRRDEWTGAMAVLSGPAGGVVATARIAEAAGIKSAFGIDMGGTSTDVCRVAGAIERQDHIDIAGMRLRAPSLALETVAAGGGSALAAPNGVMTVGPRSAGAQPGPAAYGRGGPATLTDAEAVLGRLPDFPSICGPSRNQKLDISAAQAAILSIDTGLGLEETAQGFKTVAAEMAARAVRRLAAARGVDERQHALIAFGGAGPGHATAIAEALGIRTVIIPSLAGVWSAVGVGMSSRRGEIIEPMRTTIAAATTRAIERLPFQGTLSLRLACRHIGTDHILEVELTPEEANLPTLQETIRVRFDALHREHFGFARPQLDIETVEVRLAVEEPAPDLKISPPTDTAPQTMTRAWFGEWRDVPLRHMSDAEGLVGPAILTGGGCTVVVDADWTVSVEDGFIRLTYLGDRSPDMSTSFHAVHTAVFATRVMAIAEQMGERLGRLARSVSIRERRDYSCAVFDSAGRLVANAPHVPVHLGAMGETIEALLAEHEADLLPDTTWASNDPYAGGSHLPDITVVRPIFRGNNRVGFVACRGHHVDVGGITPGSMPPNSTHIDQEGLRLRAALIADEDGFSCPDLPGCRQPNEVRADLMAQVAAVSLGESAVCALIDTIGLPPFQAQMTHLMAGAARAVAGALQSRNGTHKAQEVLDDGTALTVELCISGDRGTVSIGGAAHPGNLNAPTAVAKAAVLYVLRALVDQPNQLLNAGSLYPVEISIEPDGLFDPQEPSAVAGGNVETSQRLVDALLAALGEQAASQGTMNNLTVGTRKGVWYETIGGGSGAGPDFDGAHAVQVHMTNTRSTDIEELETRFPVRMLRLCRRKNSGGLGGTTGGDGIEKIWEFLDHATVSLLAERRAAGAPGANGGRPGLPGVDEIDTGSGWEPLPQQWIAKAGDKLRIRTPGGGGFGSSD